MSLKISIHFFTACISPQLFRTGCDTPCRKRRTDDGFNVAPFYESWRLTESVSTDGAYLAYTQGDAHENPKPEKGGERRSGEEKTVRGGKDGQGRKKTQGRKQRLRSRPLLQQTPVLHCDRCPFLWNGEHVLVLLAVDCIGWLFCVSKRRNVTEPRDRWGLYGLWQARDPCARSLATSPHGQDTEQQPDSNDSRQHQYMLIIP